MSSSGLRHAHVMCSPNCRPGRETGDTSPGSASAHLPASSCSEQAIASSAAGGSPYNFATGLESSLPSPSSHHQDTFRPAFSHTTRLSLLTRCVQVCLVLACATISTARSFLFNLLLRLCAALPFPNTPQLLSLSPLCAQTACKEEPVHKHARCRHGRDQR
jgi:hypothetical protein